MVKKLGFFLRGEQKQYENYYIVLNYNNVSLFAIHRLWCTVTSEVVADSSLFGTEGV